MTDRGSCSRAELDGRRIVVDLSDADLARLTAIAARRGVDGPQLVLGWIRRGMLSNRIWAGPDGEPERAGRIARDVETARRSEELFRDLLDGPD
jgi:hypothetical protein